MKNFTLIDARIELNCHYTFHFLFNAETGSSIAIFCTGTVGLSALMTANIEGCHPIITVDIHDSRF
jgi:threonine dehydrogenase-like Zn-dependent dehydrogenase